MTGFSVNISGAREIEAVLRDLPERVARNAVKSSLMAGGAVVVKELKATAPVGPDPGGKSRKTASGGSKNYGKLRDNIRRGTIHVTGASLAIGVGIGRAFWGMFQEFGTSRMPAHPWFRRAWEKSKVGALDAIGRALGKGVEREALKLSGEYGARRKR